MAGLAWRSLRAPTALWGGSPLTQWGAGVRAASTRATSAFAPRLVAHPTRTNEDNAPRMYLKFKANHKRAKFLMQELEAEAVEKAKERFEPPKMWAGDAVEVKFKPPNMPYDTEQVFRGILLYVKHKGASSGFRLINNIRGTVVERFFPLYSPWITDISVLQPAFIKDGKKRVRQARIYWLRNRAPEKLSVPMSDTAKGKAKAKGKGKGKGKDK